MQPIFSGHRPRTIPAEAGNMIDSAVSLRIAMLAPVTWPVPPVAYGPWEQVVSNITENLVLMGHEVTLFAAAGSQTAARLVETVPHPLSLWPAEERNRTRRLDPVSGLLVGPPDFRALEQQHIATCMETVAKGGFDIVHSHLHVHALVFSRLIHCPLVSTLHGSAWNVVLHPVFDRYRDQPIVSISNAERQLKPDLNYVATVYDGVRVEEFPLCTDKEPYLLFAGRISPEKGPAEAIAIARRAGMPLRIAGLVEPQYQDYFDQRVKPYLDDRNITYLGLLSQRDLVPQYQHAAAVLFPICWCEPCGMVAIEAQACGTPLIAFRYGALPEIIRDGRTGFVVQGVDEAVAAVQHLAEIDPRECRANAERRFSAHVMALGYASVYRMLAHEKF
jgi:glycosyltransferase involved in cell wall biosynthesis